jgi:Spy/CpxP family protein refolding chaperone
MKSHFPTKSHFAANFAANFAAIARSAFALVATTLAGAFIVTAADPPPAPGTADQPGGNRGGRGNFQGGGPQGGGRGGGPTARVGFGGGISGLGLDDKQLELYREASEVNRDALSKLDEKLRAAQKELLQAAIAEKFDEKIVGEKAETVAKIQTEMTLLRAKAFSAVAPTLKPEQHDQIESSRMAAAMLTGGGMGGYGVGMPGGPGGGFGGQGGPGGAATGGNGGFRGRGNQGGPPGSENIGGGGGGGGGGQRRNRGAGGGGGGGQPPQAPQPPPTQQ